MTSKTVDEVRKALEEMKPDPHRMSTRSGVEDALVTEGLKILDDYAEVKVEYEKALKASDDDGYREYILFLHGVSMQAGSRDPPRRAQHDADREHDVTVLDTRSLLYRIAADAETIRKQAQEIKRLTSNVERLEGDGRFVAFELSDESATLREQVRTLREALKAQGKPPWPPRSRRDDP